MQNDLLNEPLTSGDSECLVNLFFYENGTMNFIENLACSWKDLYIEIGTLLQSRNLPCFDIKIGIITSEGGLPTFHEASSFVRDPNSYKLGQSIVHIAVVASLNRKRANFQ